ASYLIYSSGRTCLAYLPPGTSNCWLTTRSLDDTELNQVKAESNHDMKKSLTWWDLTWFGIGAVICVGIFVLTGQEANQDAGPAVILYFAVSGVSAMLSVLCYTEFAVEIPVA
ncbi:hypothetical protein SOVF_137950 isoform A, partial [Spinacia oleracea]